MDCIAQQRVILCDVPYLSVVTEALSNHKKLHIDLEWEMLQR